MWEIPFFKECQNEAGIEKTLENLMDGVKLGYTYLLSTESQQHDDDKRGASHYGRIYTCFIKLKVARTLP